MKQKREGRRIKYLVAFMACIVLLLTDITQYMCVNASDDEAEAENVSCTDDYTETEGVSWNDTYTEDEDITDVQDDEASCADYEFEMKFAQTEARKVLKIVNDMRKNDAWYTGEDGSKVILNNLSAFTYDYGIEAEAMQRAAEAAIMFAHTRPDGTMCTTAYSGSGAGGENLGTGQKTAEAIMNAWKEADKPYSGQGHRRNMLSDKFNYIGVGHVIYQGYHYWAMGLRGNKNDTSVTVAWDEDHNVIIKISDQYIQNAAISPQLENNSQIKIAVGEKRELPGFGGKLGIKDHWPEGDVVSVKAVKPEWTLTDTAIAEISDGMVCGLQTGKCKLKASVRFGGKQQGYDYDLTVGDPVGKDLSKAKVSKIPVQIFDEDTDLSDLNNLKSKKGAPVQLKVKLGKEKLQMGVDYTVEIRNADKVGNAELILTSIGTKCFGTKTVSFKIKARNLKKYTKADPVGVYTYTGDKITPGIRLVDKKKNVELKEGKHFTVTFSKNVSAGKANILIEGIENAGYSGKIKMKFKIAKCPVENASVEYNANVPYTKGGAVPEVKVTVNGRVLENGVDYKLKCRNNKKAGSEAEFVIIGKGSYCGKTAAYKFTVN